MGGEFVNRGTTIIDDRNDPRTRQIKIMWYTGENMQSRDIRKFVEVIYRNFEQISNIKELSHNRTQIKKILTSPTCLILLAVYDNKIVSYAIADIVLYNNKLLMHIYYLFTSPAYRNKGVATNLINKVHQYAIEYKCVAISLTFDTYDKAITKYYMSNGFTYSPDLRSNQRYDMLVKFV